MWALAACAAVLGHLVLDSVTIGPGIMWLYPWSDAFYGFMKGAAQTGRLAAQVVIDRMQAQAQSRARQAS